MSFSDWIAARIRYRRFARGGQNIERRYAALHPYWEPHLEASRKAQREWKAAGRRLLVIGAGRLLDFEESLADRFDEIFLLDADPTSAPRWRDLERQLKGRAAVDWDLREITGKYDPWRMFLETQLTRLPRAGRWEAALNLLEQMIEVPLPRWPAAGAVLSLNTLSQLPVGWREIVEELLVRAFGQAQVRANEQAWLAALHKSSLRLVQDHLALIARSRAADALVVTDVTFHDYREEQPYPRTHYRPAPEMAQSVVVDALHGVNLLVELEARGWRGKRTAGWCWHISPLGLEAPESGSFNRVEAFELHRPQPDTSA